jgi:hypothetical protein
MNDLGLDRQDRPAVGREIENPSPHRQRPRRRWRGRLFALSGLAALAGGLSLGVWGQYSQQRQTMATAQQERDFAPSVRVATVEASPGVMLVTLPATTAAFAAANALLKRVAARIGGLDMNPGHPSPIAFVGRSSSQRQQDASWYASANSDRSEVP